MTEFYEEEEVASEYDQKRFKGKGGRFITHRENENVMGMVGDLEGKKVMDLGAGTCRYSIEFASRGANVVALDVSEEMLDIGKSKAEERGVRDSIEFVEGNALDTDYKDESFDTVTALRLFHLIDDPKGLFQEMKRLTKDRVLFDFFNLWSLRLFYNKFLEMESKLRRKRKMKRMMSRSGFYNVEVERDFFFPYGLYRFSPSSLVKLYMKSGPLLGRTFPFKKLCSVIYMGGRKT